VLIINSIKYLRLLEFVILISSYVMVWYLYSRY